MLMNFINLTSNFSEILDSLFYVLSNCLLFTLLFFSPFYLFFILSIFPDEDFHLMGLSFFRLGILRMDSRAQPKENKITSFDSSIRFRDNNLDTWLSNKSILNTFIVKGLVVILGGSMRVLFLSILFQEICNLVLYAPNFC